MSFREQITKPLTVYPSRWCAGTVFTPAANDVILFPFSLFIRARFTRITMQIAVPNGTLMDLGVYDKDFATRICNTGVVATTSAPRNLLTAFEKDPGTYWLACTFNGAGVQAWGNPGPGGSISKLAAAAGIPLPATIVAVDSNQVIPAFNLLV